MDNRMDSDSDIILMVLSVISCMCCISIIVSVVVYTKSGNDGNGKGSVTRKLDITSILSSFSSKKPVSTPILSSGIGIGIEKDIICNVVDAPSEKIQCMSPESSDYIKITTGDIIKISSSRETQRGSGKVRVDYYLMVPYVFFVDYSISLATQEIVINTLADLLSSFQSVEKNYNKNNNIADKCLNVSLDTRNKSDFPYNQTCLFFDTGFSKMKSIVQTIIKTQFPYIPKNVLNDYYNYILSKVKQTKTLSIFEYIMYLGLLNYPINKSNYILQCQNMIDVMDPSSNSLDYIDC